MQAGPHLDGGELPNKGHLLKAQPHFRTQKMALEEQPGVYCDMDPCVPFPNAAASNKLSFLLFAFNWAALIGLWGTGG